MKEIYTKAKNVLVWLGESKYNTKEAISLLNELSENLNNNKAIHEILKSPSSRLGLDSLSELFRRDYWSRVWVIQEVHFAKSVTVRCGPYHVPWSVMVNVQNKLKDQLLGLLGDISLHRDGDFCLSHIQDLKHAIWFQGPQSLVVDRKNHPDHAQQIGIFEALMMHRPKKATDPRDKIYGIVGLATAGNNINFIIDYRLSVRQSFVNTVDFLLQDSQSLVILLINTKNMDARSVPYLNGSKPTWMPDFGAPGHSAPVPFRHATLNSAYSASASRESEAQIDTKQGVLRAFGMQIGTVHDVVPGDLMVGLEDFTGAMRTVEEWTQYLLARPSPSPDYPEHFVRAILCDTLALAPSEFESDSQKLMGLFKKKLWPTMPAGHPNALDVGSSASFQEKEFRDDTKLLAQNIFDRSLFVTDGNDLGMAQTTVMERDIVCVLFGCSIPVILREVGGHYIYISDACVINYMYGKGIKDLEEGRVTAKLFEIH